MRMAELLSSNPFVLRLGCPLIHFLWQGAILTILLGAVRALFGRALAPHPRYVLSCLTLVAMIIAPFWTFVSRGGHYGAAQLGGMAVLPPSAANAIASM